MTTWDPNSLDRAVWVRDGPRNRAVTMEHVWARCYPAKKNKDFELAKDIPKWRSRSLSGKKVVSQPSKGPINEVLVDNEYANILSHEEF